MSGSAYFSRMSGRSRLRPHCGPTNARLRVHVGLSVPAGAGLRVGDGLGSWVVGGAIAFDDSFEHEVWNDSDEDRLVFIVDCWHPALRTDEQRRAALGSHDGGLARYEAARWLASSGEEQPVEADAVADRRAKVQF